MSPLMFSLQALLMRHESYIADSEREREAMTAHIEALESEKEQLENRNATFIEENRNLLDQLEAVNNAVIDSDTHVTSLQATLQSTQLELQKLGNLAARTQDLERQLADYEREQASWQEAVEAKEQSVKTSTRRWQKAERTLAEMQSQIERIEQEAREERERHVEVVGRMERRQAVEKELNSSALRLKGAALAKTSGTDYGGTSVVSHFVKDILSDNANLQMGIVELREMLQNSNDEVETLRKQLDEHQPAEDDRSDDLEAANRVDLRKELHQASSSELHVHHHYHAPSKSLKPSVRRPKKKLYSALTPGHFTPPSGFNTPRSMSFGTPSSAATILQQTAVTIPDQDYLGSPSLRLASSSTVAQGGSSNQQLRRREKFSTQSNATFQSMLSSSGPSLFSDGGAESSRPTTPDTEGPGSPLLAPLNAKRGSGSYFRTHSMPTVQRRGISPGAGGSRVFPDSVLGTSVPAHYTGAHEDIPEEGETDWEASHSPVDESEDLAPMSPFSDEDRTLSPTAFSQPLRRAASHESVLSVSAMDIHTLKKRPSQLLAPYAGRTFTSQAVVSDTQAHASRPAVMARPSHGSDSGRSLLSGMASDQRQRASGRPSLGQKVGGWVFGRWGATPAPTISSAVVKTIKPPTTTTKPPPSRSSASDAEPPTSPSNARIRPPGVNQAGPIVGMRAEVRRQHTPVVKSLDEEALRRALDD